MKTYPLTHSQQALWIEWKLHPHNTSYNTCVQLKLEGPLNIDLLADSLYDVVGYFDTFRTYFIEKDGIPYQCISELNIDPSSNIHLKRTLLNTRDETESKDSKKEAEAILAKAVQTPISMTEFPLFRGHLVQTATHTFYFLGIIPHIISDGFSALLFLEATSLRYNKGPQGLTDTYSSSKKSLHDFIAYETENHTSEKRHKECEFWAKRLDHSDMAIDFGHDPALLSTKGKRIYITLDEQTSRGLKKLASQHRTTLFSSITALFATLLHHTFKQDSFTIGYPVNIRPRGFKHLFGFFVNLMPLTLSLSEKMSINTLMSYISKTRKEDKPHLSYPSLDLVKDIRKKQPHFDGRIFTVSLAQTVSRLQNLTLDNIHSTPIDIDYKHVNDELSLYFEPGDTYIDLMIEYRSDIFDSSFIKSFISHLKTLATTITETPDIPIGHFNLLSKKETQTSLIDWNNTEKKIDKKSIIQRIQEQAIRSPHAPATSFDGKTLTYSQLLNKAKNVASYLKKQSITLGDRVALYAEPSENLVPNLLGIMLVGATYIPLHPKEAKQRLTTILEDCSPSLILDNHCLEARDKDFIFTPYPLSTPAYILYTSGSSGNPKGVRVSQENILVRLLGLQDIHTLTPQDTYLQNTPATFDISVPELFWPLMIGAHQIVSTPEEHLNPTALIKRMTHHAVSYAGFTPTMLLALLNTLNLGELPTFSTLLVAGEPLPSDTILSFYTTLPQADLYNYYGPTEASIYATYTKCPKQKNIKNNIGKPLPNTHIYICNNTLTPQAIGVAGELYIGGKGVTQGYLNRECLTNTSFIKSPFKKNDILYKTGDQARWLPHGDIKFLGRKDSQIKLRGHRIECGEIESVLKTHPDISDASVSLQKTGHSEHLIAHVESQLDIQSATLIDFCKNALIPYMVPSKIHSLKKFPYTQSGKLNKKGLPLIPIDTQNSHPFEPAKTKLQKRLSQHWSYILNIPKEKISIHDSFFDLGGDSLLVMQFLSFLEKDNYAIPAQRLFENPTIKVIATHIEKTAPSTHKTYEALSGNCKALPRQELHLQHTASPAFYTRHFALKIDHEPDLEHLNKALEHLVETHLSLSSQFKKETDTWQLSIPKKGISPGITHVDLSDLHKTEQLALYKKTLEDVNGHFSLDSPPLSHFFLFTFSPDESHLVMIAAHILFDITSCRILLEDLLSGYMQSLLGQSIQLPALTASPIQWVAHLEKESPKINFSDDYAYWNKVSQSPQATLPLKQPFQDPLNIEKYKSTLRLSLDSDTTQNLLTRSEPIDHTLIQALYLTLTNDSPQKHITLTTTGHGRLSLSSPLFKDISLSRSIGWFNSLYPMTLNNESSISEQLKAIPHKGIHFLILKQVKSTPLPKQSNIFFNYMGQLDGLENNDRGICPIELPVTLPISDKKNSLGYELSIEATIYNTQLHLQFSYSSKLFDTASIQALAERVKSLLLSE